MGCDNTAAGAVDVSRRVGSGGRPLDDPAFSAPFMPCFDQTLLEHDGVDELMIDVRVVAGQQRSADTRAPVCSARTL